MNMTPQAVIIIILVAFIAGMVMGISLSHPVSR